jgi:hypothetical protein
MRAGGRPYRPPAGLPSPRERRWRAALVSVLLHVGGALLLLIPAIAALIVHVTNQSAGAGGARGGGGGGHLQERLRYVQTPASVPSVATPVPRPVPPPSVVPPPRPPEPKPPPPPTSSVPSHDSSAVAQAPGNGAGRDETGGGGAGTGGGTGTGAGNAAGPGTGGTPGAAKIRAATDVMTLATIDPPKAPRPFHLHAVFAVDVHGDATLLTVNRADDGDFNRLMHARLLETHFKPAALPNGTFVPDTVSIDIDY